MIPRVWPALIVALSISVAVTSLHAQQPTFELPTYTDSVRWNRAATLLIAVLVGDIAKAKANGMTGADAARASAELFGPPRGWTRANTPFVLFRGMYFNWMSHPEQTCTLIEASETIVRARCNRPWVTFFGESGENYGVTVADYEEAILAFGTAIANHHGMDWEQRIEGESLLITIRKR